MYRRLRVLIVLGCMAILGTAYTRENVILRGAGNNADVLETATVDRGDIVLAVSASGPVRAKQEVPLTLAAVGVVARVHVKEGDRVLKGQALATLDTQTQETTLRNAQIALDLQRSAYRALVTPPRDVDRKAAEAALKAANAQLSAAKVGPDSRQIEIARLQLELAKNALWQTQLGRDQAAQQAAIQAAQQKEIQDAIWSLPPDLRDALLQGLAALPFPIMPSVSFGPSLKDTEAQVRAKEYEVPIAQAQLDNIRKQGGNVGNIAAAQLAIISAQSALDKLIEGATPENLAIAGAQIDAAQAALDLAKYGVSQSTLVAPFEGLVARVNLVVGEVVPADKPAVILIDDSAFYLDIPVDESDISRVAAGQGVTLNFDSLPGEIITGRVSRVATTATTIGGVVTYTVRVNIETGAHLLRSGMSATATILVAEIKGALRVRNRFVRLDRRTGRATVIVQAPDGQRHEIEVKLGLRNETYSEVQSGLAEGDTVIVLSRQLNLF